MRTIKDRNHNYLNRANNRLNILLHTTKLEDITVNISPNTYDFIAAIPLLLYIISPALVLLFAFRMQLRLFIIYNYPDILASIVPGVIILYCITLVLLLCKNRASSVKTFRELIHQPVYMFFIFAMLWMLVSLCVNGWTDISLLGDTTRHEGLLSYWGYIGVLFFLGSQIRNDTIKKWLCNISLAVSIAVAVFAIWQFYILPQDPTLRDTYPTAIFFQFNHYGYYLAIHILLSAAMYTIAKERIQRLIYLLCLAVNVMVLNVNNTFGAWLACIFGFLFMIIVMAVKDHRLNCKALWALLEFMGITILVSVAGWGSDNILSSLLQFFTDVSIVAEDPTQADSAGTTRWMLWKLSTKYISERPVIGWGIEGIDDRLAYDTSYVVDGIRYPGSSRSHNEYLQYAATFGIPEAIAYTAACVGVYIRNLKHKKELKEGSYVCLTAAFTYLVSACFGITMYNTAPFLFIFLGLGYRSDMHAWQ